MDCYVGASTGALKSISLKDNSFFNVNEIKKLQPKRDEITAMIWGNDEQTDLITAQLDRQLKLLDCDEGSQSTLFNIEGGRGPVKGLHLTQTDRVVTCVESGITKVWSRKGKEQHSWEVGEGITSMHGSNERNIIVTGGVKNLVKTWDIETGEQTWCAKNVPLNNLQLEVPVMITDLRVFDGGNQIIEATKLHEMRLYDPRSQRRPTKKIPFMESPITAVSFCHRPEHVIAANAIGEMGLFDLRSKVHPICKYKGQAGSIRSIDGHPTAPLVATCGIDRFVRVHDVGTRKLIHKIYCKTRLNKILLRQDLSILKNVKEEEEWDQLQDNDLCDEETDEEDSCSDDESSDDDVWDELNNEKNSRKRKEDTGEPPEPLKKKKSVPPRKRKDTDPVDEIVEEPSKKSKKSGKSNSVTKPQPAVEVKEEPLSDEDEPVPVKKRKLSKKTK